MLPHKSAGTFRISRGLRDYRFTACLVNLTLQPAVLPSKPRTRQEVDAGAFDQLLVADGRPTPLGMGPSQKKEKYAKPVVEAVAA